MESAGFHTMQRLDRYTGIALLVTLLVYPALYCSGIMGSIIRPIFLEEGRMYWWLFWIVNIAFHLIPFTLVAIAMRQRNEQWASIGLDWTWFVRGRWWLGALLFFFVAGAWFLPGTYYGDQLPRISGTIFLAPVSKWERLFVVVASILVGFTEEFLFRGYAITRLKQVMPVWVALFVSCVSFLFIHGTPRSIGHLFSYMTAGLFFGLPFVWNGFRRLELLILVHILIDASMVLAP